jgi:hypothetical protein
MGRGGFSSAKNWLASSLVFGALLLFCMGTSNRALAAPQADVNIPPDAIPQIEQVNPNQAAPGAHVAVTIQGNNFSAGAYVSSVSAAIHVESSKRVSATQLEAQLSVSASAQPATVSLLVSNPASRAAEAAFKVVAGQPPAAPAAPAPIPAEVKPSAPATPAVPTAPSAPTVQATPSGPEVTTVEPSRVSPGFDVDLKISGKNFVQGAKVSFANTGIRTMGVTVPSSTQLTVHIKVARDAQAGTASMFVINPDDHEAEVPFEVTGATTTPPATPPTPGTPPAPVSTGTQRFDAFHLGNPMEVFQTHGKVKGLLVVTSGTLQYQEGGKTLVNISLSEIKEIKIPAYATATFRITLNSGKTFHFAAGSLRPSETRNIVDSLRKALPH